MPERNLSQPLPQRLLILIFVGGLCIAAFLYSLLDSYTQEQRREHTLHWQEKLALSGHLRAAEISGLLAHKVKSLDVLASDTTLRLYLSAPPDDETAMAYRQYLRNYLTAVARQGGFIAAEASAARQPHDNSGIMVTDAKGAPLLSTAAMPAIVEKLATLMDAPRLQLMQMFDAETLSASGENRLVIWKAPIAPVQDTQGESQPVGYAIGVLPTFEFLRFMTKTAGDSAGEMHNATLVYKEGEQWKDVLSGQPSSAMSRLREHAASAKKPADIPSNTMLEASDTLHYLSPIEASESWFLLQAVPRSDAYGGLESRLFWLKFSCISIAVALLLMTILLWRHISAKRLALLLQKVGAHEELLSQILEATPSRIFISDSQHHYHYVNESAAKAQQSASADMVGKSLSAVMGRYKASNYQLYIEKTLHSQQAVKHYLEEKEGDSLLLAANITHLPLSHIPSPAGTTKQGVLTIEYDVTELMKHQQASKRMMDRLLEALLQLADKRDPNAAQHSQKVSVMAESLASTLQLSAQEIETARLSGLLLNMGKLMVPESLLSSDQTFSGSDKARIKLSLKEAFDYLADIPFDGPVLETLRQSEECPDKSGPQALSEEQTLITARILKVANSFVALTSPRAYRKSISEEKALSVLEEKAGTEFSRAIVTALAHYLINLRAK